MFQFAIEAGTLILSSHISRYNMHKGGALTPPAQGPIVFGVTSDMRRVGIIPTGLTKKG